MSDIGLKKSTLEIGSKVIYPGQGPCRVGCVEKRTVGDKIAMFYHLIVLDDSGSELFVPVEKADAIGVRSLMKRSEIPKLFAHLQKGARAAENWKQRALDNAKLFNSGSPFDLAEIIASLTELGASRSLTSSESRMLERARRLLIFEISEVVEETKISVEQKIDQALDEKSEVSIEVL